MTTQVSERQTDGKLCATFFSSLDLRKQDVGAIIKDEMNL
jgi:hypothetical protein